VDYVLEGSAQREASRIRITADLIKVRDQTLLWADTFEREFSGILALQSDVARSVAKALALTLLPGEQARLANTRPVNPDAYEAYLKGLSRFYRLTPDDLDAALQYFEFALTKDPDYALAYVGISLVWAGRNQMILASPSEAVPKAKAAALKAIALDDTLAEARTALAALWTWHDWNLPAAEPEWRRAIDLNPNFPDVRVFYSHYLNMMQRPAEAMAEIEQALGLDPFNALFRAFYAVDLLFTRRYDDAIAAAHSAPDNPVAINTLWWAHSLKGTLKEAFAAAKGYLQFAYGDSDVENALDQGYAQAGYVEAMRRSAEALVARSRRVYVGPVDVAALFLDAGENTLALDWLEKAFDLRDPNLPYLGIPFFDRLRPEPRYQALLGRLNLPQ
jgi:tetratricopeptide (TPR) repeat protein